MGNHNGTTNGIQERQIRTRHTHNKQTNKNGRNKTHNNDVPIKGVRLSKLGATLGNYVQKGNTPKTNTKNKNGAWKYETKTKSNGDLAKKQENKGVFEGSPLSDLLFIIYFDHML